ncbi:MAG: glycosyltransferase family 2 protein [Gammaproteobacteria bacterium]
MASGTSNNHRIAICICTCGRIHDLERVLSVLQHIQLDDYDPQAIEIIIVDNNPNPETKASCDKAAGGLPIALHYVTEPQPGVTYARNRAVQTALARGTDFVAFIDDDDEPRPDWLIQLLKCQADTGADIVFGTWVLHIDHVPEWAKNSHFYQPPVKGKHGNPPIAGAGNVLIGRGILERVSSTGEVFSHRFRFSGSEDGDLFIRAKKLNARLVSTDKSVIHRIHEPERYTIRGTLKRGFKTGCARVNLARSHGGLLKYVSIALMNAFLFLVLLPFSLFRKSWFMHNLYRAAKASGVLYATATRRDTNYYVRRIQKI